MNTQHSSDAFSCGFSKVVYKCVMQKLSMKSDDSTIKIGRSITGTPDPVQMTLVTDM